MSKGWGLSAIDAMNGMLPSWAKAVVLLGAPTVILVYIVVWGTRFADTTFRDFTNAINRQTETVQAEIAQDMEERAQLVQEREDRAKQDQVIRGFMRLVCVNTAKTDEGRAACLRVELVDR